MSSESTYEKLVLTPFEKTHDLILTAEETRIAKRKHFVQSWIRKLKVMTRPDETRPRNMKMRRQPQTNKYAVEKGPKGEVGYMPNFEKRVAKASTDIQEKFAALVAEKKVADAEGGKVINYRKRMSEIRNKITPADQVTRMRRGGQQAGGGRRDRALESGQAVTEAGGSDSAAGASSEGKKGAGGMDVPGGGQAQLRNFSNPYAI